MRPREPWATGVLSALHDLAVDLALAPIFIYQRLISPLLPPSCRFRPTCSQYAVQALKLHGLGLGSWLALRRLLRCHPWHSGGYDPVPNKKKPGAAQ